MDWTSLPRRVINVGVNAATRRNQRRQDVVRLIKRYGSRKLYDTEESRYVSLEEIGDFIRKGQEIRVIDNKSSEDVTAQTLAQVILENSRKGLSVPTSEVLHELIRRGGDIVSTGVEQLQHGVESLLQASIDRVGPLRRVREETDVLRKRLEELERSLAQLEPEPSPAPVAREAPEETAEEESPVVEETTSSRSDSQ
jgi:polyhydroxyalkanoate synthesis repressor PhaR